MRILYYSPHPHLNLASPSGYGTHMREMIAAFRELGHDVLPLIMGGTTLDDESKDIPRPSLMKRIIKGMTPKIFWESLKDLRLLSFDQQAKAALRREIERFKPDFIYERANYAQVSGVEVASERGIFHVLEVNAPYVAERQHLQGKSLYLAKAKALEKQQLTRTSKVIVVSGPLREYYTLRHGIPKNRFLVMPNCVNPDSVRPLEEVTRSIREKYQLEGKWVVGFVGSVQPWHGVDILIRAFAEFGQHQPEARLLIVGDGWDVPNLKELSRQMGLAERVIFTGNVPFREVFSYMEIMDVTVLAKTAWYCSPVKIFEYGAMSRPVIAMDTESVREVMVDQQDGLLIPAKPESLSQALDKLAENQEFAEKLAVNFHQKVMKEFVWTHNAKRVIALTQK
ncbi:MAG: glycosyltransferase family 4 protein [Bacteroidia bacterium]|nr:glycosyltransferase family 4 protein [Bacteroidia bacterium]